MRISPVILAFVLALTLVSASNYSIDYSQVGNKIVVKESLDNQKISNYLSNNSLDRVSGDYYFVERIEFNESYYNVQIRLNLDKGFILDKEGIFPSVYKIETDGQTISVVWDLKDIKSGQVFPIFVQIIDANRNYSFIIFSLIIALIIGLLIIYSIFKIRLKKLRERLSKSNHSRVYKKATKKEETKYNYLLDTEKKVIEELKKADRNELWQKQIQNYTGFSKAKISRLIRNLESRGLIKKISFGNTNKIRLK